MSKRSKKSEKLRAALAALHAEVRAEIPNPAIPAQGEAPITYKPTETGVLVPSVNQAVDLSKQGATTPEVQGKLEAVQRDAVYTLSLAIVTATGELAGKYLSLVEYIRKHSVAPKLVSEEMSKLGFKRSRISEIKRVAYAEDDVYNQYQAKLIGFDRALILARLQAGEKGQQVVMTPAAKQLTDGQLMDAEDIDEAVSDVEEARSEDKGRAGKGKSISVKLTEYGKWIVNHATKAARWENKEKGWVLVLAQMELARPSAEPKSSKS